MPPSWKEIKDRAFQRAKNYLHGFKSIVGDTHEHCVPT